VSSGERKPLLGAFDDCNWHQPAVRCPSTTPATVTASTLVSVKSDRPERPGPCSGRKITSCSGPTSARHVRMPPLQRAPNTGADLRMAPPNLFQHRYGPNAGGRLQDRHNLAVPNLGQRVRPPSAARRLLLRGQPWIILDAVAGCPAEAALGGRKRWHLCYVGKSCTASSGGR